MDNDSRYQHILQRVMVHAAEKGGVEPSAVSPATHLINDLEYDSLDQVELMMALEDEFEMSIDDKEVQNLLVVSEIAEFIAKQPV